MFAYTNNIPATINDTLEVIASCNTQGKKTATLTVGEGKKEQETTAFLQCSV